MAGYAPFVNDLARVLRNVLEAALVEHLTTPEGAAVMGKLLAFHDAVTPALQAAVSAWGRELGARLRALSCADALETGS